MGTLASLLVKIGADISGLTKGLDEAEGKTEKTSANVSKSASKTAAAFGGIGDAMTVGVTLPILAFGAMSVKAIMDNENAMAELNAVIKSTGGAAGVTAKSVTDYASEMQGMTKFSDEAIISGTSMLLTFTKIGKNVMPLAQDAMLNMAEKFGSMDNAAVMLGKALNDPVVGMGALREAGVTFSPVQQKQIRDFMAMGKTAEAQKVILRELSTEFGGLAIAAGDTTAGKLAKLTNNLQDLGAAIGTIAQPALIWLVNSLNDMITNFTNAPKPVQGLIIAIGGILAAIGPVIKVILGVQAAMKLFAAGGALAGIIPFFTSIGTAMSGAFAAALPVIAAAFAALLPFIIIAGAIIGAMVLLRVAWDNNWGGIQERTINGILFIIRAYQGLVSWVTNIDWGGLGKSIVDGITLGITMFKFGPADAIMAVVNWLITKFKSVNWKALGSAIVQGIMSGILDTTTWIKNLVTGWVDEFLAYMEALLGIASPSKVFAEIGRDLNRGLAVGIKATVDLPTKELRIPGADNIARMQTQTAGVGVSGGGTTNKYYGRVSLEVKGNDLSNLLQRVRVNG